MSELDVRQFLNFMRAPQTPSNPPDPEDMLRALAAQAGLDYTGELPVPDPEAVAALPAEMAWRYQVVPVGFSNTLGSATLVLAISDPFDFGLRDSIEYLLRPHLDLEFVVSKAGEISRVLNVVYPRRS